MKLRAMRAPVPRIFDRQDALDRPVGSAQRRRTDDERGHEQDREQADDEDEEPEIA